MAKQLPHKTHAQTSDSLLSTIKRKGGKKGDHHKFQHKEEH